MSQREWPSRWGDKQRKRPMVGKLGQRIHHNQTYILMCAHVCTSVNVITLEGCDVCLQQAHAGGPHFGNLPKTSACTVGSGLHRNHSHVQPNSFPKWTGSLECYLGCALLRCACRVCSALVLSPPFPIWAILPVSKLPNFNQMATIMLPPLFSL